MVAQPLAACPLKLAPTSTSLFTCSCADRAHCCLCVWVEHKRAANNDGPTAGRNPEGTRLCTGSLLHVACLIYQTFHPSTNMAMDGLGCARAQCPCATSIIKPPTWRPALGLHKTGCVNALPCSAVVAPLPCHKRINSCSVSAVCSLLPLLHGPQRPGRARPTQHPFAAQHEPQPDGVVTRPAEPQHSAPEHQEGVCCMPNAKRPVRCSMRADPGMTWRYGIHGVQ